MMKKLLATLLAMCLTLSFFACSPNTESQPGDTGAPTSGQPDSPSPDDSGPDASSPPPASAGGVPLGTLLDGDHFSREPFKIAYVCNMLTWAFNKAISDGLDALGKKLNYEYTAWAANGDFDAYVNQIYTFADQGYDALVLGTDDALAPRAYDAAREAGIAFVGESTTFQDDGGVCIWPSVQQAQVKNGQACVEWLAENYGKYWGDVDLSAVKLGLICLDFSGVSGITERKPGVSGKFAELFPNGEFFDADLVALGSEGFSVQGGQELTSQLLSQNPDIEKWFVVALVDDWAVGATRAAEQLKMEDDVLTVSIQADAFLAEMNSGYVGDVYVAACAVSANEFAVDMANCLVAILDGRVTAEDIWPEWRDAGGTYPRIQVEGTMITRDTYGDYLAEQSALLG
ncbi:MAG: substrate-binding domain-containing protein [Oscillospiraceae bacterium]|nr:substrate-binding domain-containing protein [Oscillospiraceae bacterium]